MTNNVAKLITVPVDGSPNSLKALDYVAMLFGAKHNLNIDILYIQTALPPILIEEGKKDPETFRMLQNLEKKNTQLADSILKESSTRVVRMGFAKDRVTPHTIKQKFGVARDIANFAEDRRTDAVLMNSRGRTKIETFFMGSVAEKVIELNSWAPVWIVKGAVKKKPVMIALDRSASALKAVDHAAFMLAGTGVKVTLFYAIRHLRRFVPAEIIDSFGQVEHLWKKTAGEAISENMSKARDMLIKAGIDESLISVQVVDGGRNASTDIIEWANKLGCGTIILGRRGTTDDEACGMGSVSRKVLCSASDTTVCLV
jgi:nucleotide-binding universal stress UspA family protein